MRLWLLRLRIELTDILRADFDEPVAVVGAPWRDLGRRLVFLHMANATPRRRRRRTWGWR